MYGILHYDLAPHKPPLLLYVQYGKGKETIFIKNRFSMTLYKKRNLHFTLYTYYSGRSFFAIIVALKYNEPTIFEA